MRKQINFFKQINYVKLKNIVFKKLKLKTESSNFFLKQCTSESSFGHSFVRKKSSNKQENSYHTGITKVRLQDSLGLSIQGKRE